MGDGREITRKLRAEGPAPTLSKFRPRTANLQGPFAGREGAGDSRRRTHQGRGREAQCGQLSSWCQGPTASLRAKGGRATFCRQKTTAGWTGVLDKGAQTQSRHGCLIQQSPELGEP